MSNRPMAQCENCGIILDQEKEIDLPSNICLICTECYYKHVLQSGLDGLPIIDDYVAPEVIH